MRGLIIFPGALGDLICLLPAIRALTSHHPEITFELMARAELARLAVGRMSISAAHSIDRAEVARLFIENGGGSHAIRSFFEQFSRIDCFFAAGHEQFRTSLKRAAGGSVNFYSFRPLGRGHIAECYLREVGAPVFLPAENRIDLLPEDVDGAMRRLRTVGAEPGGFLLILPGSGSPKKNWPPEYFVRLAMQATEMERASTIAMPASAAANPASAIHQQVPTHIQMLVVLGPAEAGLEPIFAGPPLKILKDIELGELAGIARMARCFVGNDSGVSHLAAASGARGLVIFGPSEPERWRPLGAVRVIRKQPLRNLTAGELRPLLEGLIKDG